MIEQTALQAKVVILLLIFSYFTSCLYLYYNVIISGLYFKTISQLIFLHELFYHALCIPYQRNEVFADVSSAPEAADCQHPL